MTVLLYYLTAGTQIFRFLANKTDRRTFLLEDGKTFHSDSAGGSTAMLKPC